MVSFQELFPFTLPLNPFRRIVNLLPFARSSRVTEYPYTIGHAIGGLTTFLLSHFIVYQKGIFGRTGLSVAVYSPVLHRTPATGILHHPTPRPRSWIASRSLC